MAKRVSQDVTGTWSGVYSYLLGADEFFMADLAETGGQVTGIITETPQLVPDRPHLRAVVDGERRGDKVTFIKRYDGTAGWGHTVSYRGKLSPDGLEIGGSWTLQGAKGTFLMVRAKAQDADTELEATVSAKP